MTEMDPRSLALRLARRQAMVRRLRAAVAIAAATAGLVLLAVTVRRVWWPALDLGAVAGGLGLAGLAALAWVWWRTPREPLRLVRRADRLVAGEEQLSTAYELQSAEPENRFLPLLLRRCQDLLARVDVAAVVPVSLGRWAMGALGFALVAALLTLVPASWLQPSRAAAPEIASLVAEEGTHLESLAERLSDLAEEKAFRFVEQMADAMAETAERFQTEEMSPLEAGEELQELSQLAGQLAEASREERPPTFQGEEYEEPEEVPTYGLGEATDEPAEFEASGVQEPPQRPEGEGAQEVTMAEDQRQEVAQPDEEMSPTDVPESPYTRAIRDPDADQELEVLQNTEVRLQQTARNMLEQYMSEDEDVSDLTGDPLDSEGDPRGEEVEPGDSEPGTPQQGEQMASGREGETPSETSDAPSQAKKDDREEAAPVEDAGFEDTRIAGTESDQSPEDARWIRQLPVLNPREIRADGTVPQFSRTAVTARSGRALPRAYRSVVKAYYLELERITAGAE